MSEKSVVVVESPAKAKTINAYLGKDYTVLASFGHVRDLPAKDGSVKPDEDFAMSWEVSDRAGRPLGDIKKALKGADRLILATDPDREGEAISWHIRDVLQEGGQLKGKEVERVTFNAITKASIKEAFGKPRALDQDLVDAYLGRRALDYLVGFTLSPILWRKLPGSRSAGRVQSVALRLICDREDEIEAFKPVEYWSIAAKCTTDKNESFWARLSQLNGKKLDKFDLKNAEDAAAAAAIMNGAAVSVVKIEQKETRRQPYAPFITSSLQMEASRKLGFGAQRTMRLAQQLYEGIDLGGETVGLITYMRTDGISLSPEGIAQARDVIAQDYGQNYVPESPRVYKSKAKNAQEAHEAIRPTDISRRPAMLRGKLDNDQWRLYDLIWKRTVASQMEAAVMDNVAADIAPSDGKFQLRATGQTVKFPGFLALYTEDFDDKAPDEDDENAERRLPKLNEKDPLSLSDIKQNQHFTQPPPRYSEASLVKKMEEEGIGRPSTYASILQVLQDRNYVRLENKRFFPEDRGRIVTAFLVKYFPRYVEVGFTAAMEQDLDAIAEGQVAWREMLRQFWTEFQAATGETKDLKISDVIDALDETLGAHFFPERADGTDPRSCPACNTGRLSLKLGKFGAFIGCSNYPECKHTQKLDANLESGGEEGDGPKPALSQPIELGNDPATGLAVSVRPGPYGPYVQMEAPADDAKAKPKRQGLPKGLKLEDVTLEKAVDLLRLPRFVGMHPDKGEKIEAGVGRFGPYLKIGSVFISLPKDEDVLTVGINRAVVIVDEGLIKKANSPARGRFAKKKAATGEAAAKKPAAKKKAAPKKAAAKKPAAKKPAAKKPAAKKA